MIGEDPLDSVASEFMSEVLECASQARISPRRVLPRHAHNELTDDRQSGADQSEGSTRRVVVLEEAEGLVWARWSE